MQQKLENCILKLDENVLKRFEFNVNGGTLFLYNASVESFWFGNKSAFRLLNMLDGVSSVEHICCSYSKLYPELDFEDIKSSIISLFEDLLLKKFLKIVAAEDVNERI